MDVNQRAFSSSNLTMHSQGILSPPWACPPPIRAHSTMNLSGPQSSNRNRALSWSPVRFDSPVKTSCLPWVRKDTIEAPLKKKTSIDGSVLKAKLVWEEKNATTSKEVLNTEKELPKKASGSFRFRKAPSIVPNLQRSSTGGNIFPTLDPVGSGSPKLREKKNPPSSIALDDVSRRRLGFVQVESDHTENLSDAEADTVKDAQEIVNDNIQSNGGRQVRRGGAGGMGDGSHPFVRTSPFSSSSSSPIITQ
ncbi:uncharacterized protein LOC108678906, partial [Hyalella azteca]|uniref:Uncharacterized protein LOC108678906 n=1 Tax=Hyalella azteca TaxID=294128 RepID=A0A8B7PAY9_HYAAZ